MQNEFFYCKSKRIADYLKKHGSAFIGNDEYDGAIVYVFVNDDSIKKNLDKWESEMKKCLF